MTQGSGSYSPIREFVFALLGAMAFAVTVMENIELTHPGVLEHHHAGGQLVMVLAAFVFGGIVGSRCGR